MTLASKASFCTFNLPLKEASGDALDAVGSLDLAESGGTVGSGTGLFYPTARDFEADDTEVFTRSDNAVFNPSGTFMFRVWLNFETDPSGTVILFEKFTNLSNLEYGLWYEGSNNRFRWYVSANGTSNTSAYYSFTPTTSTWYCVHCWHDADSDEIGISVDAGTASTAAHSTGVIDGTGAFGVGARVNTGFGFDGLMQDLVLLDGTFLDSTERTADVNSGAGVPFTKWNASRPTLTLTGAGR